jgi:hypothetical protein
VGVIPIDDVITPVTPGVIRFLVLQRLVMSPHTLVGLRDQINLILQQMGIQNASQVSTAGTMGQSQKK